MSTISNLIFNGASHYVTSPYGRRNVISTSAGNTSSFHYGTDYGTNNKKIAQYAIEDGSIISCGRASDGANYIWVKYPRINKKMLHYHLDSISVKTGQTVHKGTLLGYTGMTGKATGIHLHLGIIDLGTGNYLDPEAYAKSYSEGDDDDMTRGYFKKGDENEGVLALKQMLILLKAKGVIKQGVDDNNIFGDGTEKAVKELQDVAKIMVDGLAGEQTLRACKKLLSK